MIEEIISDAKLRMAKSVESLRGELVKLRTGRAHPSLLEQVMVDYYGSPTALNQVANVTILDARTLQVVPWEKTMIAPVEKAIMNANLGLNPCSAGVNIRVPLPALNEERRKDLTRMVRDQAEHARIAVRNIRRDANSNFKDLLKEKDITEDDLKRAEGRIQKTTDEFIKQIDEVVASKEKELMEV